MQCLFSRLHYRDPRPPPPPQLAWLGLLQGAPVDLWVRIMVTVSHHPWLQAVNCKPLTAVSDSVFTHFLRDNFYLVTVDKFVVQAVLSKSLFKMFYVSVVFKHSVFLVVSAFMLEKDPKKRPDIFQVSHVAFHLAGKSNPVTNFNVSSLWYISWHCVCVCGWAGG